MTWPLVHRSRADRAGAIATAATTDSGFVTVVNGSDSENGTADADADRAAGAVAAVAGDSAARARLSAGMGCVVS